MLLLRQLKLPMLPLRGCAGALSQAHGAPTENKMLSFCLSFCTGDTNLCHCVTALSPVPQSQRPQHITECDRDYENIIKTRITHKSTHATSNPAASTSSFSRSSVFTLADVDAPSHEHPLIGEALCQLLLLRSVWRLQGSLCPIFSNRAKYGRRCLFQINAVHFPGNEAPTSY
ncbi:unnamed protein product [Pleuronectes platessa]|uniref:Uncharacterized protein n=1 Tax=Pleuronectes platessa TaxID=8262 RepID=A0A9N7Z9A1_PLEPL|nr:unnamed protein product [Pleuronectes platessa]